MTKAPDRIWARLDDPQVEPGETTGKWVDHGPGEPEEKLYLLSTPAREAAEELLELAKAYEAWEADVILNADWSDTMPKLTQQQWDHLIEIQTKRNVALSKTKGEG